MVSFMGNPTFQLFEQTHRHRAIGPTQNYITGCPKFCFKTEISRRNLILRSLSLDFIEALIHNLLKTHSENRKLSIVFRFYFSRVALIEPFELDILGSAP
ncbi:Uncharacterized protein XB16_3179 [Leptospira santarosai]|uniref:Uncharacterized protein n=1 Tax=Leptospira santarosai TaxID=28183 RepID=A0A2P1QX35_9LEPT|nr:Uncharacterized protein XB16_3179 [Leptospira santarosai]